MASAQQLGSLLGAQLANAVKIVEEQVDEELKRMENMDEDDLEMIRRKRIEDMKKAQNKRQEMLTSGHGKYSEVADEKEFFEATKKSNKVVCLFYTGSSMRSKIVDKHMEKIAPKHIGTRFIKIDAEKAKFLSTRLNIRVIPTIAIIVSQNTTDYIRGFDDLGGHDEFKTEVLETRLARSGVITLEKKQEVKKEKKIIRCGNDSDSAEDW
ncbi:txdc-9 [Pristionchus pacificus]|uniref:Thioredoxin domain-containing protein 9 n=1 Tax=Pristionchus pacificus TaxID=54126 RepID=A0A8R1V4F2_PRIPA|nr:txdc-9 [Pristionchus pacificus]